MAVVDRICSRFTNVPTPLPTAARNVIAGALRMPMKDMAFRALLSAATAPLVPLVTTALQLQTLVTTVANHTTLFPDEMVRLLATVNGWQPNVNVARDVVLGFGAATSNFLYIADPRHAKLTSAITTVLAEPTHTIGLTGVIRSRTFDNLRQLVRRVEEPFLADAFRILARFHGTAHANELTQQTAPAWAKVYSYAPPNGSVSAVIRFNAELLADHVRKHLCLKEVQGQVIPDAAEPVRWIDYLDYRERITRDWLLQYYPKTNPRAYIPSHTDLQLRLAQWVPTTVWNLS
jgi:hypothetical protein